jgi:hypothetical protein
MSPLCTSATVQPGSSDLPHLLVEPPGAGSVPSGDRSTGLTIDAVARNCFGGSIHPPPAPFLGW